MTRLPSRPTKSIRPVRQRDLPVIIAGRRLVRPSRAQRAMLDQFWQAVWLTVLIWFVHRNWDQVQPMIVDVASNLDFAWRELIDWIFNKKP